MTFYVGEPGCGKTTLVRGILNEFRKVEEDEFVVEGPVKYHRFNNQKTLILGVYDDSTFAGCDKLSKSAGPRFREWLVENEERYKDWGVILEGERFMNSKTLEALFKQESMKLVRVVVSEQELERRRAARNNVQDPKWMKGMRTQVENVCNGNPHEVIRLEAK